MSSITVADGLKLFTLAAEAVARAQAARAEARRIAALAGVSEADLDAAEARYTRTYVQPDAPAPTPEPTPAAFPYFEVLTTDPRGDARLSGEYVIWQSQNDPTKFYVEDGQIGGGRPRQHPNATWPEPGGWQKI